MSADLDTRAPLTDGNVARAFLLAGNARLTLRSLKTGARFTYRVRAKDASADQLGDRGPFFVSLLSGPDNEADYQFLGTMSNSQRRARRRRFTNNSTEWASR